MGVETAAIHGRGGNDTIVDPGRDTVLYGDEGDDTIVIDATFGTGVSADGGDGSDTYVIQAGHLNGPVAIADTGAAGTNAVLSGASGRDWHLAQLDGDGGAVRDRITGLDDEEFADDLDFTPLP